MEWRFQGRPLTDKDVPEKAVGFIYLITNLLTGKLYIGKKLLTFAKTRQVKGKKKRSRVASNWKSYYGSNKALVADVQEHGEENFSREVLRFCSSKGSCNYYEAREQFLRDVLKDPNYYNDWIQVKVSRSHVKD